MNWEGIKPLEKQKENNEAMTHKLKGRPSNNSQGAGGRPPLSDSEKKQQGKPLYIRLSQSERDKLDAHGGNVSELVKSTLRKAGLI